MARIEPPNGRTPIAGLVNAVIARRYGKPFPALSLMGHNRGYPFAYAVFSGVFGRGRTRLPEQVRRLASQLVAEINGCAFCIDLGERLARDDRIDLEKLRRVLDYETHPGFSAAERAALRYACEATQVGARVSDETFAELARHFGDREILELTVAVATENFYNRLNAPLGIEAQGFCALPERATS